MVLGQFGVGFYSTFMVAEKVEVFSKSATAEEAAHRWVSDGSGEYEIAQAEGVQRGKSGSGSLKNVTLAARCLHVLTN